MIRPAPLVLVGLTLLVSGCGTSDPTPSSGTSSGGVIGSGGSPTTVGGSSGGWASAGPTGGYAGGTGAGSPQAGTGGSSTGGASSSGGASGGTGGASASGGAGGATGGASTTGGASGAAGGANPSGGANSSGGASGATGGARNTGGATGTSGTGGAAGAGAAATGGMAPEGGTAGEGPVVGTPTNPILPGYNADPQIALFDDTFYIYPTTDGFPNWSSTSFSVFSSKDLATWTDEGVILDLTRDVSWANGRAWAPGIARKDGVYYYYFSADQQIGVATADSPTGPFEDALGRPLIAAGEYGGQSIDPCPFIDDDGRAYLYFGSTSAGGHVVELNDDMISFKGTPQQIVISGFKEGIVAFKRNDTYYFMYSEGDTRSPDYDVAYGTGSSPMGPFTKASVNPILRKNTTLGILGTGHNSILTLPNGDTYIVYHRFGIPGGDGTHREVCIDRLYFNEDGTIVPVTPTH